MKPRPAQLADRAVLERLHRRRDLHVEIAADRVDHAAATLVERGGRIVAASWYRTADVHVIEPTEPLPLCNQIIDAGVDAALLGCGICVADTLDRTELQRLHRLVRTMHAEQLGVRYTIAEIPLPAHPVYDARATVQQIAAGALPHRPLEIALADGYWPHGVTSRRTVWVVRRTPWA